MPSHADHASDAMTLLEVIRALEDDGYTGQFGVTGEGAVRCFTCRTVSPAEAVHVARLCRTEGASDPADMVAVAAVRCPQCRVRGTLALKYGPGSGPEEEQILAHLDDSDRRQRMAPATPPGGDSAPVLGAETRALASDPAPGTGSGPE